MKSNSSKNKIDRAQRGQRGFTLVEMSIAMVVMMVAALGCSSLFVFSMQNNVGGNDRALAMGVAQQQMEEIRSVDFDDATLTAGTVTSTVRSGERDYTVQRVVADELNADNSPKQLRRITITVTPQFGGPNWTRTPVVLVTLRSTLSKGSYVVSE
jgi:prepilin-type N-terminal cleavage/methylation domain-containing protein